MTVPAQKSDWSAWCHQRGRTSKRSVTASRYRGVWWDRARRRWRVEICKDGQRYRGKYRFEIQAALAYDRLARELYGEFAVLNFPLTTAH